VITEQDVRNALNLAVIEQMKLFALTCEFFEEAMEQFPCSAEMKHYETLVWGRSTQLICSYADGGIIHCAMPAQSIYSSIDVIILHWLDYLHIIDVAAATDDWPESIPM
jgi:hypothetical protein